MGGGYVVREIYEDIQMVKFAQLNFSKMINVCESIGLLPEATASLG